MNNPFDHGLMTTNSQKMVQTFAAITDIPGSSVEIDLRADKTKEKDPKKLCGSKHAVWIGIQPPPPANRPNQITPFENNIVVAFWANDTSGGGILDIGAVMGGIGTMITDPKQYEKTVASGLDIVNQNYQDCKNKPCDSAWGCCKGEFTEASLYTATYIITTPVRAVAAVGNWAYKGVKSWFAETDESFAATDFLGLDYHSVAAAAHKVSIEISCKYKGETRIVHDTELAGTSAVYGVGNNPKPALAYFVIDSPGEWKVRVRSLASGNCADPNLDVVERFNVPEPPTTDKSAESKIAVVPTATGIFAVALIGLATAWVWRSTR